MPIPVTCFNNKRIKYMKTRFQNPCHRYVMFEKMATFMLKRHHVRCTSLPRYYPAPHTENLTPCNSHHTEFHILCYKLFVTLFAQSQILSTVITMLFSFYKRQYNSDTSSGSYRKQYCCPTSETIRHHAPGF